MKYTIILLWLSCLLGSASYAQQAYYTPETYFAQKVFQKTGFDQSKVVFLEGDNFLDFVDEVLEGHLFSIFGIVTNDELYSASTLDIPSCRGQILALCESIDSEHKTEQVNRKIKDISFLKEISFDKNKKTVVFIFSNLMRKRDIRTQFRPVFEHFLNDPAFDYIVLSLDASAVANK